MQVQVLQYPFTLRKVMNEDEINEMQIRLSALDQATKLIGASTCKHHSDVLEAARAFYKFLKGDVA